MIRPDRYHVAKYCHSQPSLWELGDDSINDLQQILVEFGAELGLKSKDGKTPADVLRDEEARIQPLRIEEVFSRNAAYKKYSQKSSRRGLPLHSRGGRGGQRGRRACVLE